MKIVLLAVALLLLAVSVFAADNLWVYTNGTKLLDADPAYFTKLETRVFRDPQATPPTYIICVATISLQNRLIHLEKRRFIVGVTGEEGPERISWDPPYNMTMSYRDVDIVDGIADCVFAVLSQTQYLTIGNETSVLNFYDRIETVYKDSAYYTISGNDYNVLQLPTPFWVGFSLPNTYSFETLSLPNGDFFVALSGEPSENMTIAFLGSAGIDTQCMDSFESCIYPTMAAFNDSSIVLCVEHYTGVACIQYPFPGLNTYGFLIRSNTAEVTYTRPRLSTVNSAANFVFLSSLRSDTTQISPTIEVVVMNMTNKIVFQTQIPRDSAYKFDAVSVENYLFLTYADDTGLKMDVFYYGETVPPYPPPVAPISSPVAVPVVPPISTPVVPPVQPPKDDQNNLKPPVDGLNGEQIGAIVGSIVGGAVAAGAIVLAVLLARRKNKKKAQAEQNNGEEMNGKMSSKESTSSSSSNSSASSSSNSTPYDSPRQLDEPSTVAVGKPVDGYTNNPPILDHYGENQPLKLNIGAKEAMVPAEIEKRMKIPYKSLVFIYELGSGNFGKVFKGEWHGAEVAIKVSNQPTNTEEFLSEAKLTLGISPHPNVVQTFGVSLDGPNPCIVLGFCGGGSLDGFLKDRTNAIDGNKKRDYALKIAYGLLHLHQNNIVHRDLAARNILLANDGTPKISDFGMSRVITSATSVGKTKQTIGPLRWMAPENIANQMYSAKSDVWSYGILVWEIVSRKEPHYNEDQLLIGAAIRDSGYHPAIPLECDPALRRVMEMCWQKEPEDRPTMEDIIDVLRSNSAV